ncbi:ABC transporter permease [Streptomyces sp. RS10V-4]|uniref:FtsX-like permease family protein n=1 Tax=Streptomyces rhizoryzae TaxID=2932493 RepID=UPI002002E46A|nr:FtsX-like permease family protein [Streptomyces rhizoryzae]MCK7627881.1 ABC transporter permease [Streptomyces rhizoryzae]
MSGRTRPRPAAAGGPRAWARDLAMGMRFAAGGGREGWTRTLLTALGVGLGVTLLLAAASLPTLLENRTVRREAVAPAETERPVPPSPRTLVQAPLETAFRSEPVRGQLLRPDGARPPLPPGVTALPGPDQMVLSPALRKLLHSPEGALLRPRLPFKDVGTIGPAGLVGPGDLAYYAGSATLTPENGGHRIRAFGVTRAPEPLDAKLLAVLIVGCVVLLMPVALFIATAVRFGGERRDRRLAALRLIGADARMTRRTAAGEALFGALCGLLVGTVLFLVGRQFADRITFWDIIAFPSDVTPVPWLAALVAAAVPLAAVAVTLLALRRVGIEPLGVVRSGGGRRRRLWWRLPFPAAGIALLLLNGGIEGSRSTAGPFLIGGGAALFLLGVALLLPWAVDATVSRLSGGPVPWQLAVRRLQLSGGTAARAVSGITVAVAGAIALQLLFSAIQSDYLKVTGQDSSRAQLQSTLPSHDIGTIRKTISAFRETEGVRGVIATIEASASRPGPLRKGETFAPSTQVTVGDCATLRELARTGPCKDGDVFVVKDAGGQVEGSYIDETARPGATVDFAFHDGPDGAGKRPRLWTVPRSARTVESRKDPMGQDSFGLFATPGALDPALLEEPMARAMIQLAPGVLDAVEHARNTAAGISPLMSVRALRDTVRDGQYTSVRTGLGVAAGATLALIAASMLVTMVEQLRERRRLLSVLVAFGTRRATLAWSVLWQTAVPVVLGLALALSGGLALGLALLRMAGTAGLDWSVVWPLPAAGAALIAVVTLLSLPPLWRMMRPEGLRTE